MNRRQIDRADAIAKWSTTGIGKPRDKFAHEIDFEKRMANDATAIRPHAIPDQSDTHFRRQFALTVDAFDLVLTRPDLAFDSVHRAFEDAAKRWTSKSKATDCYSDLAFKIPDHIVHTAWQGAPVRSTEFLVKRVNPLKPWPDGKVVAHVAQYRKAEWSDFKETFTAKYPSASEAWSRDAALLLRRLLRGETLDMCGKEFTMPPRLRSYLLLDSYLASLRNERSHGAVMPPFLSSKATIKTYTVTLHATLVTYHLLAYIWSQTNLAQVHDSDIRALLEANLSAISRVMGANWE